MAAAEVLRELEARLREGRPQRLAEALHVEAGTEFRVAEDVLVLSREGRAAAVLPEFFRQRRAERDRPLPCLGLRVFDPQPVLDQVDITPAQRAQLARAQAS